jgi:6-pyruvoyltetrahydropterin/6-carboxytetrahydropterin synthase
MYIKIDGLQNHLQFSASHFIPTIEKCSRLHGHDYSVSLEIHGEPIDGILIDYGIVKGTVRKIIDEMDHKVLMPRDSKFAKVTRSETAYKVEYLGKSYSFPAKDVYQIDAEMSSSEMMSSLICRAIAEELKIYENLTRLQVCLYEGPGQCACAEETLNGR